MFASRDPNPLLEAVVGAGGRRPGHGRDPLAEGRASRRGQALGRGGDWYGRPVNLAARITSFARPDSVVVDRVRRRTRSRSRTDGPSTSRSRAGAASRGSRARSRCTASAALSRHPVNPRLTTRRNAGRMSEVNAMALLMLFALVAGREPPCRRACCRCSRRSLPRASPGAGDARSGVVPGLALSFTFATVALVYVIDALGLPNGFARDLAIAVLCLRTLAADAAARDRVEAFTSRMSPRPARSRGDGFGSGLLVGAGLGFVYAPCAGPILAGVITVSASQDFSSERCSSRCLRDRLGRHVFLLMVGGRQITPRLKQCADDPGGDGRGDGARRLRDVRQPRHALPDRDRQRTCRAFWSTRPAAREDQSGVERPRGAAPRGGASRRRAGTSEAGRHACRARRGARLRRQPALVQHARRRAAHARASCAGRSCSSTSGPTPASTASARCRTSRPGTRSTTGQGIRLVGVHTPEFPFEKYGRRTCRRRSTEPASPTGRPGQRLHDLERVQQRVLAGALPDRRQGKVRAAHFGEGDYERPSTRSARCLPRPARKLGRRREGDARRRLGGDITPETYLGAARAQGFANGAISRASRTSAPSAGPAPARPFAYAGHWKITGRERDGAAPATRSTWSSTPRRVFLVLGSTGRTRKSTSSRRPADPGGRRHRRARRHRDREASGSTASWTCGASKTTA